MRVEINRLCSQFKVAMKSFYLWLVCFFFVSYSASSADLFLEAESFAHKGGWVLDTQFVDQMGSSYLMAHGMGQPVADATAKAVFNKTGEYTLYVRTYNWTSPWSKNDGPGKFQISVNGQTLERTLGCQGQEWEWQKAGSLFIQKGEVEIQLHDLTGFNARCDALYFTTRYEAPPQDVREMAQFRKKQLGFSKKPENAGSFDLVVVGGGIAGMSTAISAARLGLSVALVQNRPLLGGNNSSEIRVHLGGRIENEPYKNLGNLQKEFGPTRAGNARPAEYYEDQKKLQAVLDEPNITLLLNYHVFAVQKKKNRISSILAKHTENAREISLHAPLFADCTGDGNVGYLAGADFRMGREAKDDHHESLAPDAPDTMTLGASVQWYSEEHEKETNFPYFQYGLKFNELNFEKVAMGEWTWETGMNMDQIREAEKIRDYGMLVIFSNWSYLKNEHPQKPYKNHSLAWVAYIAGKRESRRLLGDHILTENDIVNFTLYPDASAITSWSIDLHYPDPKNSEHFKGAEFKSIAVHKNIHPYPIPYRCLYSRNIDNLFIAGRNISVTHVALGTTRVMRTCGIIGEVVGMAASLCKKYQVNPRGIYQAHLEELKTLMEKGVGDPKLPNTQTYNLGGTLGEHPSQQNK